MLSPEQKARIQHMREQSLSFGVIARALGIGRGAVAGHLWRVAKDGPKEWRW